MKPEPENRIPLVVVACEREGMGLVQRSGLQREPHFHFPGGEREAQAGFYFGPRFHLAITGVLEHNMVAATALILLRLQRQISCVVNFGAVGCYRQGADGGGPVVGDVVMIRRVCRFDVDDNVHWARPIELHVPNVNVPVVSCVTGSRYSTAADRQSSHFPHEGQVEDMELYGLAVLLQTFQIPLLSVKYVVNTVEPSGREQLRQNIVPFRQRAEAVLMKVLRRCHQAAL
jgi:nucleoside phosphorylase